MLDHFCKNLQIFEASLFCMHTQSKCLFFFFFIIWKYLLLPITLCAACSNSSQFLSILSFFSLLKIIFYEMVHEHVSTVRFFFQHSWNYSSLSQGKALAVVGLGYLKMTTFAQTLVVQLLLKTNVFPFTSWLSLSLSLSLSLMLGTLIFG